jgi:hypothetical protein
MNLPRPIAIRSRAPRRYWTRAVPKKYGCLRSFPESAGLDLPSSLLVGKTRVRAAGDEDDADCTDFADDADDGSEFTVSIVFERKFNEDNRLRYGQPAC